MSRFGMILVVLCLSPNVLACPLFKDTPSNESLMFQKESGVCVSWAAGIKYTAEQLDRLNSIMASEEKTNYADYWSAWVLNDDANLFLSQSLASNYIGVGVWVPSELEEQMEDMDTEQWLLSHGLQLSLGFGDKKSGKPRMRFDYRWHEDYDGDVMMQLEVPF